ncbi:hypothetical protein RND71_028526 [Anisodus tanguticus]|uniref:Uncharacterized protein n=1 Tax=Anisodus tanguticus TaxID=243964 RepID=A0AAE1RJU0_9SOLA|nr:hypothetical protein RND71_028526 [Anisodus tanguticus]
MRPSIPLSFTHHKIFALAAQKPAPANPPEPTIFLETKMAITHSYGVEIRRFIFIQITNLKVSLFMKMTDLSTHLVENHISYDSTNIEKMTDKFLEWELDNCQVVDPADVEKSNVFKAFDNIYKVLQVENEKEKKLLGGVILTQIEFGIVRRRRGRARPFMSFGLQSKAS